MGRETNHKESMNDNKHRH